MAVQVKFIFAAILCMGFLTYGTNAHAQLTAADIIKLNQEGERIQRERALQQERDSQDALRNRKPAASLEVAVPEPVPSDNATCRDVSQIDIIDAALMQPHIKTKLTQDYVGKCLNVNDIQKMMGAITAFYIKKGYATTRVYLPAQDLSTGTLKLQVIEGKVEAIRLKDGSPRTLAIGGAFPGLMGDYLNLRDIEQGLDQVNRLASNNATMDIMPGSEVGQSIVVINNKPRKRWHMNVSADNYGTVTTGRYQAGVTLSFDNLIGLNEFYNISQKKTGPLNDPDKQSSSTSVLFSVPYGYYTFTAGFSASDYNSRIITPSARRVNTSGNSHSIYGKLNRLVYRDRDTKVNLNATLTNKESNNYVEGALLGVSSRTLTVLDLGVAGNTRYKGGSVNFGFNYARGLKLFNALEDLNGLPDSAARAQFDKVSANLSYYFPFVYKELPFSWNSAVTAQYGFDTLYGSEQMSVGGIYSVRGFYEESLANDNGVLWRNDVSFTKNITAPKGITFRMKPYLAIDAGGVDNAHAKTSTGFLMGAAAGVNIGYKQASFDFYIGHPLFAPSSLEKDGFNSFARLSVNF